MKLLAKRDPFVVTPFNRLFDDFFSEPFMGLQSAFEEGTLALDISEDDHDVIVRASLPGFARDEIEVEIHDGMLSIKAEQTVETESKDERFYRRERRVGSVNRRVALPSLVSDENVKAELRDGVLTLRLPKTHKDEPKKIKIK